MKSLETLLLTLFIFCAIILGTLWITARTRYDARFDQNRLIGKNKAEIIKVLGHPQFDTETSDSWVFQEARDPDAYITFSEDKVSKVEKLR